MGSTTSKGIIQEELLFKPRKISFANGDHLKGHREKIDVAVECLSIDLEPLASYYNLCEMTGTSSSDWRDYHDEMKNNMLLKKLGDATRIGDRQILETCIPQCEEAGYQDHLVVKRAHHKLNVIKARDDLKAAMEKKDLDEINDAIDDIHRKKFQKELHQELVDGERMVEKLSRTLKTKTMLALDSTTLSEVRRYQQPPTVLHDVLTGALLLLGEHEMTTADWTICQKLLNPQGAGSITKRFQDLDVSLIEPEIYARSKEILQKYNLETTKKSSPAATTFYVWAMGILDDFEQHCASEQIKLEDVTPASVRRQVQLLDRQQTTDTAKNPWPNRPRPGPN